MEDYVQPHERCWKAVVVGENLDVKGRNKEETDAASETTHHTHTTPHHAKALADSCNDLVLHRHVVACVFESY